MFMVAASVVTTIMVLNYHHRLVDTHEMPDWVINILRYSVANEDVFSSGAASFSTVDALDFKNVSSWRENHKKDHSSTEENERTG